MYESRPGILHIIHHMTHMIRKLVSTSKKFKVIKYLYVIKLSESRKKGRSRFLLHLLKILSDTGTLG